MRFFKTIEGVIMMQHWSNEMWMTCGIGVVVGFILAYVFLRLTKDSVKKQVKTEAELQQVKSQLDGQKQQLEKHFAESAELLKTLAQDYQKLYRHLAHSSAELLPELENKPFTHQLALTEEQATSPNAESAVENSQDSEGQPRDYSEGSSGLLKDDTQKYTK